MCIRYPSSSLRAFIFPSEFVSNQWWITKGCDKSWAALFGWHSFSSCVKSPLSAFLLTYRSLHRHLSIQQTVSAGTSLLPMDLGLSPVLVLAILLQGHMPAHAWLEDDNVSVFTEVLVQSDGCNSASPANICNLLSYLHIHRRDPPTLYTCSFPAQLLPEISKFQPVGYFN